MAEQENTNPHHRHDIADKLRAMGVMPGHVNPTEVESGRKSYRFVEIMLMLLVAAAFTWFIIYLNKLDRESQSSVAVSSSETTSKNGDSGNKGEVAIANGDTRSASTDTAVASNELTRKESTHSQTAKSSESAKQPTASSSSQGAVVKAPVIAAQPYGTRPGAMQPAWGQRPGYHPQFNPRRVESTSKAGQVVGDKQEVTAGAGQKQESTNITQPQQGNVYPYAAPPYAPYQGYYPYPPPGYRPYAPR